MKGGTKRGEAEAEAFQALEHLRGSELPSR